MKPDQLKGLGMVIQRSIDAVSNWAWTSSERQQNSVWEFWNV